MRLLISWLKEYVDFEDTPKGLAEKLTFSGTEVEGIETVGSTYDGIVVGEVLKVDKHPNADKLTLCLVNIGPSQITVVCGAPNVKPGLKVPFAPVGVTLPNGMKLKPAKIRGVVSEGMLCAQDELKISEDHSGLMVLEDRWPAGTSLSTVLGPPETVLELEVTPNRPDCLSMIGMAREVAALYGTKVKIPSINLAETGRPVDQLTRVDLQNAEDCPRYTARIVEGIKIGPAPDWMRKRLELSGIRAINNVVDITNYVMLECGQPLHAFDQALLEEGRIVVRAATADDRLATLDGIDRKLTTEMLVIADAKRPVALAGVMGGAGSEIRDATQTVLLESAYFKPQNIRATSKKLGLSTESSYRFERGIDIGGVEWASRRAAVLMAEHAGGRVARGVVDQYPSVRKESAIVCRFAKVKSLLGVEVSNEKIAQVFESLALPVVDKNAETCTVKVPLFRVDLEREVDLVEEFARVYGLDKIPAPAPKAEIVVDASDPAYQAQSACRRHLVGLGLREIMNYSFLSESLLNIFDTTDTARRIVLPYPVSMDHSVLRTSLIPQMVETLGRNHARQLDEAVFFELGRVFFLGEDGKPAEEDRLAMGLMGPVGRSSFEKRGALREEEVFRWLKGAWENLASALGVKDMSMKQVDYPFMEPGRSVELSTGDVPCGCLGLVKSAIRKEWRLGQPVAVLEVRVAPLLGAYGRQKTYSAIAQFPSISRDAALVVDQGVRHEDILKVVKKVAPKELEKIKLFDIFAGEGIGAGKKSLAYSFTYRSLERTLTDEEANRYHELVKNTLRKELSVEVRES